MRRSTMVDKTSERRAWKAGAARLHFGSCDDCQLTADAAGRPLLVARQERCRLFLCFDCFLARRSAPRRLKRAGVMAAATGIEWCDATFNPWGCEGASPECELSRETLHGPPGRPTFAAWNRSSATGERR